MKVSNGQGARHGSRVPQLAPDALAGVRRILCAACGGRVFADYDSLDGGPTRLVCSHCGRVFAEVAKPPRRYVRGPLPAGRPRKLAA